MHEQCQTVVLYVLEQSARTNSIKMSAETAMRSVTELLYEEGRRRGHSYSP